MGPGMFDGLGTLLKFGGIALVIAVPLAVWKLVDLFIWGTHHIKIH